MPNEPFIPYVVRVVDAAGHVGTVNGTTGGFVSGTGLTAAANYSVGFGALAGVDTTSIKEIDLTIGFFGNELRIDELKLSPSSPNPVPAPPVIFLALAGAPLLLFRRLRKNQAV